MSGLTITRRGRIVRAIALLFIAVAAIGGIVRGVSLIPTVHMTDAQYHQAEIEQGAALHH